ncbi:2-C-methyl-D-erythritol 4-phosphate cytidylyltransferase [Bacteroidetes/Chlorobi group bacterium MS-B_bin-24]|nr:MAG: 2-C-methyl-D-erythritol 4-phosphate cytidylyltransferase [Bacteroidetes/Chlorobi group bacterium MS-B_bin-24]
MKIGLILTAGGIGKRFGSETPKQFVFLKGKPLFILTLDNLLKIQEFNNIILTYPKSWENVFFDLIEQFPPSRTVDFVEGGSERFYSVWNALQHPSIKSTDIVLIHDAVRPFVTSSLIERLLNGIANFDGVIPGIKVKDTLKESDENGVALHTLNRNKIFAIQTPQAFKTQILVESYSKAINDGKIFTDDSGVAEFAGFRIKIVEGEEINIKITSPLDFAFAEFLNI